MKNPRAQLSSKPFSGTTIYAVAILAIVFFAYNAARAWFVAITHDEAFTFNEYVRAGLWDIVRVNGSNSNNHVLNTLVIKVFYKLFGNHWFILRLHSVLLYGVYLYYGYKLLQHVKSQILLVCGFILLSANPFLFDFFSLARGYLPALACTLASLHFAIEYIQQGRNKTLWKCLVIAALAVLFHLSFLNYFVPLCGLLLLYILLPKNASGLQWKFVLRKGWPVILVLILIVSYALPVSLWIKSLGEMELAGKTGFWQDTVLSLLGSSFYNQPYAIGVQFLHYVSAILIILLIFSTVLFTNDLRGKNLYNSFVFVSLLLLMMFLCIEAQHFIMNNPFPNGRLALFFVPLFVILITYALDKFSHIYIGSVVGLVLTVLVSIHFIKSINFTKTSNWASDADTPEMLKLLFYPERQSKAGGPIRLGTAWIDEPNINYYRINGNYNWLRNMSREGYLPTDEYIYTSPEAFKRFNKDIIKAIKVFPGTGNILARNIYSDSIRIIASKKAALPDNLILLDTMAGSPIIQLSRQEINADSVLVEAEIWVRVEKDYVGGSLVIATEGMKQNKNIWRSLNISDGIMRTGEWQQICYSTVISLKDEPDAQLRSYIWNTGKIPLEVSWFRLKVYNLDQARPLFVNE